jgi:hypothetical protein
MPRSTRPRLPVFWAVLWLAPLAASAPSARAQETRIEVIPLAQRPAESLAPLVQRLIGAETIVTAASGKLIVNGTPAAISRVRELVRELDTPARSLWISVRQDADASASVRGAAVSGQVQSGGVTVRVPETVETRRGNTVETRTTRTEVRGAFASGSEQATDSTLQQVRASEGLPAFIRTGQALPVTPTTVVPGPGGPVVAGGTGYVPVETGFYATPYLSGDIVTLELSARKEGISRSGAIETQALATTVSGRLGEWIELGEALRSESARTSGLLSAAGMQASERRSVLVRIEEIR